MLLVTFKKIIVNVSEKQYPFSFVSKIHLVSCTCVQFELFKIMYIYILEII